MNQLGRAKAASDKIVLSELDVSRIDDVSREEHPETKPPFALFMAQNEDEWYDK